jgi:hypothetical protein
MTIALNHTIVPARDKEAAARFFFGRDYNGVARATAFRLERRPGPLILSQAN